jgi:extradiol dioxygenase family protein
MDTIHHIAIQVSDIEETLYWYKSNFDVIISYQDRTWALIEFENVSLALVMPDQHPSHFAILDKQAEKHGHLVMHRDGTQSVYIQDPSGNAVEMLKLPEA